MVLVTSEREQSSRRKLFVTLVLQGAAGLALLVTLTILRASQTAQIVRTLGPSATPLIAIFIAFALALSLLKFKLTHRIFVALGLIAATTMLPLLGVVISAWIAVAASATSRLLAIKQIGPNKSDLADPVIDYLRAFAQFATYGIPTMFAGTIYARIGGHAPLLAANWNEAARVAIAGVSLLLANHLMMKQVEAAYGYSVGKMIRVSIADGAIYALSLPFSVLMVMSYATLGAGAILGWAFTGVLLNWVARNLAVTREARDHLVDQLASLSNVGKTISLRFTIDELLMAIYKACRGAVDTTIFTIALYDESTNELACELDIREGEILPKFRVQLGHGLNSWVVRNGKLLNLGGSEEEAAFGIVAYDDGKPTESWLGVPMIARDHVIGSISVQSYRRNAFSTDDEILLTTIANQAAVALDNAQLFRDLEGMTTELERRVLDRTNELNETNIQLQAADRTKNQFLANMSHELRTPLNSIIGFSAVLLNAAKALLPARLFKFIENINIAGNHLLDLINDILDLSKIEAGKLELQPQEFDLRNTIASVERVAKGICNSASVTLVTSVDETLPTVVLDEGRTKQMLLNLISNAVKFSKPNSYVHLSVEHLATDRAVRLTVKDSGIGMPAEELPKIFDQFYQIEKQGTRQGTGLGLSLTRGFVELHGGTIAVESQPGSGSTFMITLPVHYMATAGRP
ncbi:MAG TPA: ATP-binding protein [Thermoanaerobaculia bacterium]|nr:ATP-binding protein [Thermoanaerobaculia bacterium]